MSNFYGTALLKIVTNKFKIINYEKTTRIILFQNYILLDIK